MQKPIEPGAIVLAIGVAVVRADIPIWCERVRALLDSDESVAVVCDLGGLVHVDAATVDALARLQMIARRYGRQVWLRQPSPKLQQLVALMGLVDILPLEPALGFQPEGEPEKREQLRGVEEEADPGDSTT